MNARKISVRLISVALVAAMLIGLVFFLTICNFKSYESSITVDEDARLLSSDKESITILQLTDVQTANLIECGMAYPTVRYIVDKCRPDLIVLTGDNISNGSSRAVLSAFVNLLDSFELPWGLVFGNHDRNSRVSMENICAALEESKFSIFKTGYLDDRYGNYYYNIELGGEVVRSLIFMDSAKSNFTEEQVEWYKDTVNSIAEQEGKILPSFVFFHIPIKETVAAHELYAKDPTIGSGEQREEVADQGVNTGFFDAVKELGSTDALIYGHDHTNNTFIEYEDVLFCYGTKSAITVDFYPGMLGGNLITVTDDGFTIERVR